MNLDERVFAWSAKAVTVDGADIPREKNERDVAWGCRSPSVEDIMAGKLPEPEPGVRVLAAILARAVLTPAERAQHFEGLCTYLATLPPPAVMPEVRIRGNELRQHAGVPIVPAQPAAPSAPAPAEHAVSPPPDAPPTPQR